MMSPILFRQCAGFAAVIAAGGLAGVGARAIGLPLPFMIGGLLGGVVAATLLRGAPIPATYPAPLRKVFVAVIGAMIGGTFTPDVVALLPALPLTLCVVTGFVAVAHVTGFFICRRVGGYDLPTAFFGSMPGGLIEGVLLGERAGGDLRTLTLQHFTRVIFVATVMPFLFWVWSGKAVGSAAGVAPAAGGGQTLSVTAVAVIALAGLWLGGVLRLPASHLMGPLLLAAVVQVAGWVDVAGPGWLLALAQLMVGCGLAMQVAGTSAAQAGRVILVSLLMVATMTAMGLVLAFAVAPMTALDPRAMVLSLAPGGISEMGLIALSLNLSPVIVAAHHLYRIALTVLVAYCGLAVIERRS